MITIIDKFFHWLKIHNESLKDFLFGLIISLMFAYFQPCFGVGAAFLVGIGKEIVEYIDFKSFYGSHFTWTILGGFLGTFIIVTIDLM
jgi:uncharacterized membrane protein YdcZ (DUF606 family)